MSSWTLFLDDERFPAREDAEIVICRTSSSALAEILARGCPTRMLLDHDLGEGDDTSSVFYPAFEALVLDGVIEIPEGFTFDVHSMNPVGARNLQGKIECLLREIQRRSLDGSP